MKDLRRLIKGRSARVAAGLFVVEGPVLILEALHSNLAVQEVFAEEQIFSSHQHGELFSAIGTHGAKYTDVVNGALEKVLSTRSPQPIAALVELPSFVSAQRILARSAKGSSGPVFGLIEISDPGNLGTMLRTAEAAGVCGVIVGGASVDVTNPKVVRASAGAVLRMPLALAKDLAALASTARASERPVFNTVLDAEAMPYEDCPLAEAFICFGNEARGLETTWRDAVGTAMTIRLAGPTESLNVAASAAIIGFESLRQRRARKGTISS